MNENIWQLMTIPGGCNVLAKDFATCYTDGGEATAVVIWPDGVAIHGSPRACVRLIDDADRYAYIRANDLNMYRLQQMFSAHDAQEIYQVYRHARRTLLRLYSSS
jgi:hypothetical protein